MITAQEWLNRNYPLSQRSNITKLLICNDTYQTDEVFQRSIVNDNFDNPHYLPLSESLVGTLDLSSFSQLRKLRIKGQYTNKLVLTNCSRLREILVEDNLLREIDLPLQARNLKIVDLTDNNFYTQNLSNFSRFPKLRYLYLGTNDERRIRRRIYNRWNGSLIHLENLTKLEDLNINATDVDSGLEYLPIRKLIHFICGDKGRAEAGVNRIKEICEFDEEIAASEDIDENLDKVNNIRYWQREQRELQNQIEAPANNRVRFRN